MGNLVSHWCCHYFSLPNVAYGRRRTTRGNVKADLDAAREQLNPWCFGETWVELVSFAPSFKFVFWTVRPPLLKPISFSLSLALNAPTVTATSQRARRIEGIHCSEPLWFAIQPFAKASARSHSRRLPAETRGEFFGTPQHRTPLERLLERLSSEVLEPQTLIGPEATRVHLGARFASKGPWLGDPPENHLSGFTVRPGLQTPKSRTSFRGFGYPIGRKVVGAPPVYYEVRGKQRGSVVSRPAVAHRRTSALAQYAAGTPSRHLKRPSRTRRKTPASRPSRPTGAASVSAWGLEEPPHEKRHALPADGRPRLLAKATKEKHKKKRAGNQRTGQRATHQRRLFSGFPWRWTLLRVAMRLKGRSTQGDWHCRTRNWRR